MDDWVSIEPDNELLATLFRTSFLKLTVSDAAVCTPPMSYFSQYPRRVCHCLPLKHTIFLRPRKYHDGAP